MSKPTIYIPMKLGEKFEVAFPDHCLPEGSIDKTKTRLGITYSAFHAERDSLTLVSNVPIIDDAIKDYHYLNIQPVYEKVDQKEIEEYLKSDYNFKRLVCTPESFGRIVSAAIKTGKLEWLLNIFVYMDEDHCYATEAFRDNILNPFKYLDGFKHIAWGSATPFKSSDPKYRALQHYKITYEEKFGKISIINHHDPKAVLHYMLTHPEMFPGQVHIFFNTVTGIGEAVMLAGLNAEDCNVFCRKDERNEANLGEAKACFKEKPDKTDYKKFNFYSCRYNEGWNLEDDETATIILVTDVRIPHSVMGIEFKAYQAMGRLNHTSIKRYHITNNYNKETMKTFDSIQERDIYNAERYVPMYNQHLNQCNRDGKEDDGRLRDMISGFSDFEEQTGKATLNYRKLDQLTYGAYYREPYSNKHTIAQTWQSRNYNTEKVWFDVEPIERKGSAKEVNKQVIARYLDQKEHPEKYVYKAASETIRGYRIEFELLFQAIEILTLEMVEALDYDNKAMKEALINKSNRNAEAKLRLMLLDELKVGERYSKKVVKSLLQRLYNELQIRNVNGSVKVAKAKDLESYALFLLEDCKIPTPGKAVPDNGYKIVKLNCIVKEAA